MPSPLKVLFAMLACAFVLGAATPAEGAPTPKEKRLVAKINDVRAAYGLRTVRLTQRLNRSAHHWARHLLRSDSFHHARLASGTSENLAWGTCSLASARVIVRMWMDSPGHRAALLERGARRVGPGVTAGSWRGYSCVRMAVARFR
jgi:uncharacterized protein YkwD